MTDQYKLENTKKVAEAIKLNQEDTDLLIKAVVVDIKANLKDTGENTKKQNEKQQNEHSSAVKKLAEKSRIIK